MIVTSEEIKIGDQMRIAGMSARVTELRRDGNYIEVTGIRNGDWRREYMLVGKLKSVVRDASAVISKTETTGD